MMNDKNNFAIQTRGQQLICKSVDNLMKQVLNLAQCSLPENQFLAFRKMVMDFFADTKRSFLGMEKGRCGNEKQNDGIEGGDYE